MGNSFGTEFGKIVLGNSLDYMDGIESQSIDLIMTSPPFGLLRQKDYGNKSADEYLEWFKPFAKEFKRILKDSGSLVIDIGGSWLKGKPVRSLYHYELLIMLCNDPDINFNLAQEFFWWNPAKLPSPAEWVNIRRVRVKDAVNCVWWLSKSEWPKASNRRVLTPYSSSMHGLLRNGYDSGLRPSGHDISNKFSTNNGAAIPPNLLAIANTESNSQYIVNCKANGIKPHPARFPSALPEFFIRMLTDQNDLVFDPFAGSCVTGEVAERLGRRWICSELSPEYIDGAKLRFPVKKQKATSKTNYTLAHPSAMWTDDALALLNDNLDRLPVDGGRKRPDKQQKQGKSDASNKSTSISLKNN